MQGHYHAVVWIDHRQARVFHFNAEDADKVVIHPEHPVRDYHRKEKRDRPSRSRRIRHSWKR